MTTATHPYYCGGQARRDYLAAYGVDALGTALSLALLVLGVLNGSLLLLMLPLVTLPSVILAKRALLDRSWWHLPLRAQTGLEPMWLTVAQFSAEILLLVGLVIGMCTTGRLGVIVSLLLCLEAIGVGTHLILRSRRRQRALRYAVGRAVWVAFAVALFVGVCVVATPLTYQAALAMTAITAVSVTVMAAGLSVAFG